LTIVGGEVIATMSSTATVLTLNLQYNLFVIDVVLTLSSFTYRFVDNGNLLEYSIYQINNEQLQVIPKLLVMVQEKVCMHFFCS
jgi:hypothetical protein